MRWAGVSFDKQTKSNAWICSTARGRWHSKTIMADLRRFDTLHHPQVPTPQENGSYPPLCLPKRYARPVQTPEQISFVPCQTKKPVSADVLKYTDALAWRKLGASMRPPVRACPTGG